MGLLSGLCFSLFYTLAGMPIARLADRGTRRTIVAAGLAVWSAMTAACGLAASFAQLALARFGVGIGEAAGTPPSHSLISDYFPPERRATALAVYGMGIYFGVMFGFLAGGMIRDAFDWRTAFLACGVPGVPLALLVYFTVREPPRGASEGRAVASRAAARARGATLPLRAARLRAPHARGVLPGDRRATRCSPGGRPSWCACTSSAGTQIGLSFGLIAGIGGAIGITAGGALADRLARRDLRWHAWLSASCRCWRCPSRCRSTWPTPRARRLASFALFYLDQQHVRRLALVARRRASCRCACARSPRRRCSRS